ncbi:Bug family tripartite tricarboxylate transporter substrate binding protein [Roseateles noduli]|uniref:Bug family tripartite tricarboxylate transporter substrate binding protein n=1 Tax=Roseateles noduli TaxID=2052484 RepID=UPI003D654280
MLPLLQHPWRVTALLAVGLATLSVASAQTSSPSAYPNRAITLVVGYPPGGSTDLIARALGLELGRQLGQTVIVENLGGAGGSLAAGKVANAPADGYTLLVGANNEIAINALVRRNIKYSLKDFTPLGFLGSQPLVLAAPADKGVKTTADFLRKVRAQPDRFSYGSSGIGTSLHVAAEMVKQQGRLTMTHIPYKGTGPLTTDLIGGNLDFGMFVMSSALPLIRSGKIVPIGITEKRRSPVAPDIPALAEDPALKDVDISVWFVLMGPARLPEPVATRLRSALVEVLKHKSYRDTLETAGTVLPSQQPDLPRFLADETEKYRRIVQFANIKDE